MNGSLVMLGSWVASPLRNTPSSTPIPIARIRAIRESRGSPGVTPPLTVSCSIRTARSPGDAPIIGDDPIVVVLAEKVSDAHLAGLRKDGVSYIFAGERVLDLGLALDILNRELGIKRLEVNGGGVTNGAFLRAGLIDEISLAIFPAVDGAKGAPSVFDSCDEEAGVPAPVSAMTLESSEVLEGGGVWLRYRLQSG